MIIVDRIENGFAVCEFNGNLLKDVPLTKISGNVQEGDVLIEEKNGTYIIDVATTKQRRADMTIQFEKLKARNKK
ncbi:MAG: DUF3006 domain-containing protein [Nitrososphaerota archaeon]|jgi:hypothetical protein|nr:DUF3006 domain-containing protein [Nitrososphaerota archaeon]